MRQKKKPKKREIKLTGHRLCAGELLVEVRSRPSHSELDGAVGSSGPSGLAGPSGPVGPAGPGIGSWRVNRHKM